MSKPTPGSPAITHTFMGVFMTGAGPLFLGCKPGIEPPEPIIAKAHAELTPFASKDLAKTVLEKLSQKMASTDNTKPFTSALVVYNGGLADNEKLAQLFGPNQDKVQYIILYIGTMLDIGLGLKSVDEKAQFMAMVMSDNEMRTELFDELGVSEEYRKVLQDRHAEILAGRGDQPSADSGTPTA